MTSAPPLAKLGLANRQLVGAAGTDASASRKRSRGARWRVRVYTALALLAAGFATVAPTRAGVPTVNGEEGVKPPEAETPGAAQSHPSRPAHRWHHVTRAAPYPTTLPSTGNATDQLNQQELSRLKAAPPPAPHNDNGIVNFFSKIFH
jgi:hypothetical protein